MLKNTAQIECFVAQEKLTKAMRQLCTGNDLFLLGTKGYLIEAKHWIDLALEHLSEDPSSKP